MILPGDTTGGFSLAAGMKEAFSGEGLLAGSVDFEYRPEQQEMAEAVGRHLKERNRRSNRGNICKGKEQNCHQASCNPKC